MLNVVDLTKSFTAPEGGQVEIVRVPRFVLAAGEQRALRGESGSGKTTFLHLIAGILAADGGRAEIEWFVGPHKINGKGTFEFLDRWLKR